MEGLRGCGMGGTTGRYLMFRKRERERLARFFKRGWGVRGRKGRGGEGRRGAGRSLRPFVAAVLEDGK